MEQIKRFMFMLSICLKRLWGVKWKAVDHWCDFMLRKRNLFLD